jgi:hypothetical protein
MVGIKHETHVIRAWCETEKGQEEKKFSAPPSHQLQNFALADSAGDHPHARALQFANPSLDESLSIMWQLQRIAQCVSGAAAGGARRFLHRHSWHYTVAGLRQSPTKGLECRLGSGQGAALLERLRQLRACRRKVQTANWSAFSASHRMCLWLLYDL